MPPRRLGVSKFRLRWDRTKKEPAAWGRRVRHIHTCVCVLCAVCCTLFVYLACECLCVCGLMCSCSECAFPLMLIFRLGRGNAPPPRRRTSSSWCFLLIPPDGTAAAHTHRDTLITTQRRWAPPRCLVGIREGGVRPLTDLLHLPGGRLPLLSTAAHTLYCMKRFP